MTYTATRNEARALAAVDVENFRDAIAAARAGEDDFEVDCQRFISSDTIDGVLQDELASDPYVLGCFRAGFIANILDIDAKAVEDIQKAGAFEALGKMLLPHIQEVASDYASADGYGHHFNHWDGGEKKIALAGRMYHVFRTD